MNIPEYIMRGGEHPDIERENIERSVVQMTTQMFLSDPKFHEKGLKWLFNLNWFRTVYCSRDPKIIDYLYRKKPFPEFFELEVTTACDMRCTLCEHTHWKEKPVIMTYVNFLKVLNQFPNLKWAGMTGIGQSWLNPNYMQMLRTLKEMGVYIENFDNFKHINSEVSEELVKIGLDKLYVSMDASKKETFEKIQSGAEWEKVIENIVHLDKWKKVYGKYYPELWFHFIVNNENIDEMEDYLQMIHDLGVEVEGVQFTKLLHAFKEIEHTHVDISEERKQRVYKKAAELGIKANFNMNTSSEENKSPQKNCTLWTQPFIFADGNVIACCSMNEQNDRDWQKKTCLGNLFEKPMKQIWEENYGAMTDKLKNGECPDNCGRCILYRKYGN